jgi:hypothetical protein
LNLEADNLEFFICIVTNLKPPSPNMITQSIA